MLKFLTTQLQQNTTAGGGNTLFSAIRQDIPLILSEIVCRFKPDLLTGCFRGILQVVLNEFNSYLILITYFTLKIFTTSYHG